MNKKSILYILVVLMTLSLTLSAVSADDVATDEVVADEDAPAIEEDVSDDDAAADGDEIATDEENGTVEDEIATDEEEAATEIAAGSPVTVPIADVSSDVKVLYETPYEIIWGVYATNNGPDTAFDTMVRIDGSDNLFLYSYFETLGEFIPKYLTWDVGDLLANQTAVLLLDTIKIDYGPYWVDSLVVSDSFDPDLTNNFAIGWADVPEASAAEKTMPAAGNPIAMALLALVAIVGTTISRRF